MSRVQSVCGQSSVAEILKHIRKQVHITFQINIVVFAQILAVEYTPHMLGVLILLVRDVVVG